jgi:hypothetical protein
MELSQYSREIKDFVSEIFEEYEITRAEANYEV